MNDNFETTKGYHVPTWQLRISHQMTEELPSDVSNRLEDALYRALGRAVVEFAQLDLDIALCLQGLISPTDARAVKPKIDSLTTKQKIDELQRVVASKFRESRPLLVADFGKWCEKARNVRQLRNDFVHGRWGISPVRKEICFMPPGLPTGHAESPPEKRFQLSEFERDIGAIADLSRAFQELRRAHRESGL